jgi:hypothetical protein
MIADRTTGRTVESTLTGEVIHMGIDQNAMAHIMNVLTDLYSNPLLAIIREYSTNAFDAMIEAGLGKRLTNGLMTLTRPVEIATPTKWAPFLRIKDSGVGLDAQGIREVYSQYGNSTKRATNDQVGMLGLGCKSALTYTDNFVVVSVKDGERVEVSIERNADGAGVMKMPTVSETNLPNGTEVIIPIKAEDTLKAAQVAEHFFSFWQPESVLVNGEAPTYVGANDETLDLNDGRLLVYKGKQDYVVMGNVPYPVQDPLKIKHNLPQERWNSTARSVIAFVDIGKINFPPSRETLMATPTTKATIAEVEAQVKAGLERAVQREIETADSGPEAILAYHRWIGVLGAGASSASYRYKGNLLPVSYSPNRQFEVSKRDKWATRNPLTGMLVTENSETKLSASEMEDSYGSARWDRAVFVTGFDLMSVTPTIKRKLRMWATDKSISDSVREFALVAEAIPASHTPFIDPARIVDFATITALKLPTQGGVKSPYGRLPGSYDLYDETGWRTGVAGDDIDQSKPIFYVHGRSGEAARYASLLKKEHSAGFYVVALSANRIDKFCRIIPTAKTALQGVKDIWAARSAKYTADQRLALHIHDQGSSADLKRFYAARLDDPALKAAITLVQNTDIKTLLDERKQFSRVVDTDSLSAVSWSDPLDSYPLFEAVKDGARWGNSRDLPWGDHMYLYINAAYQATTTNKGA